MQGSSFMNHNNIPLDPNKIAHIMFNIVPFHFQIEGWTF